MNSLSVQGDYPRDIMSCGGGINLNKDNLGLSIPKVTNDLKGLVPTQNSRLLYTAPLGIFV